MHEIDLNDLSDDADYAASQQQVSLPPAIHGSGSNSVGDGSRSSALAEPTGSEVVFQKDNVAIHPTQYASERISGRLRLLKRDSSLFMAWIPYKERSSGNDQLGQSSHSKITEKDRSLYTIKAVPVTEIRSICRHNPAIGWQYLIVVLSSGLAYPPLYFYNGGIREFIAIIKQYVLLVRSADDANVFLVNDMQDPLQRTLSSLELPRAVPVSNGMLQVSSSSVENQDMAQGNVGSESTSTSVYSGRARQRIHDPAHDVSIQVLEKFSIVTKFARDTTSHLFREMHNDGYERKSNALPAPATTPGKGSNEAQKNSVEVPAMKDNMEVDKLSLVWGKPRQPSLSFEEWKVFLDSEGRITDPSALIKRVFYGGVEHNLRKDIWKFLLGYHSYDSTYAEREYLSSIKKSEYETMKHQWKSISSQQARRYTKFRERKGLIEKDVVRTDRSFSYYDGDDNPNVALLHDILLTYSFYNFDLGYCQGMSDLLGPILFVMEDESESFWCFAALMERLGANFNRDQSGMHSQLFALSKLVELLDGPLHNYFKQADCLNYFFCFRWILIQFKREFEYEMLMQMWEVFWTHHLSEHFHLYICVAILKRYRKKIMGQQMDFDTLLKFINELSGQIDLNGILRDAEALCICAGENGAACIPPGTPPSLPSETELVNSRQDDEIF